jgi:NADH:ubiquinone oxidoreductase subunit 4 (subunit M)
LLWYGYVYYVLFNLVFLSFIFALIRLYLTTYINQWFSIFLFNRIYLSIIMFFFLMSFTFLNYMLDSSELILFSNENYNNYGNTLHYINNFNTSRLWSYQVNSINLLQVYTYPFIYVFILVTVLSITYCLSYNVDDLTSFMFYCQLILTSGYALFFTDSIVLFFLFYEFLLVPSFFILYKFAKTRRCVEAAYLMFF